MYDLIIIGGGPAGTAAGVYASRKQLKTALITESFGGQSVVSDGIENWIGDIKISGADLAKKFKAHLEAYAEGFVDIKTCTKADKIEKNEDGTFKVSAGDNKYETKAILIVSGSNRRKLPIDGADKFENRGLMYCATCDGPLFKDKTVAVIGGGNSALEGVAQLLAYAKKVYLIHRREEFRADPVTVESVKKDLKLELILNAEVTAVSGEMMLDGIKYKDTQTNEEKDLPLDGVFVEIGAVPNTGFVEGLVNLTDEKTIEVDPWTQRTSVDGIWAAGDVTNVKYHQNNIAAGDAVKALEDIYIWVKQN
jgi:alkyl hydroperoxide reductase subunit F